MKNKKTLISIGALLTLLITAFFHTNLYFCSFLLALVSLWMMYVSGGSKKIFIFFLWISILGSLAEAISIYMGAWSYTETTIIGVPLYLFFLWGNAGLFIRQFSKSYEN